MLQPLSKRRQEKSNGCVVRHRGILYVLTRLKAFGLQVENPEEDSETKMKAQI